MRSVTNVFGSSEENSALFQLSRFEHIFVFLFPGRDSGDFPSAFLSFVFFTAAASLKCPPVTEADACSKREEMANAEEEGMDGRSSTDGRASCKSCHH